MPSSANSSRFRLLAVRPLAECSTGSGSSTCSSISSSSRKNRTRFGMIETFQRADGFRICILSPLAAGVGLTITAANHVIHLERHWNPAKEAQATDRVYRIGQTATFLFTFRSCSTRSAHLTT